MITLLLAGTLLLAPRADTLPGAIRGQVRSASTDRPLVGAVVELRSPARSRSTLTDSAGDYAFAGVRPGRAAIRASLPDHEPLEVDVLVPAGGALTLDLSLEPRPLALRSLVVHGRAGRTEEPDSLSAPRADAALAEAAALQGLPAAGVLGAGGPGGGGGGGVEPPDPPDVLYVRGLSSEQKLVLLDGAPVYAPFHLGGLLEPFEPGVLSSATMYLGGAPARYDGGLSYILDLTTRRGDSDRVASSGAVDLLGAHTVLEGPLAGGATFLLGGRAVHALGLRPFLEDDFPYSYGEGLARVDVPVGNGSLAVTGFANREAIRFDSMSASDGAAAWSNGAASVRYHGSLLGSRATLTAAFGAFTAALPSLDRPAAARGRARRLRLAGDFERGPARARLGYGVSYEEVRQRTESRAGPGVAGVRAASGGAYVEREWRLSDEVRLRGGLRGDVFSVDPAPRIAPRVSLTWALSDDAALTAAVGAVHQYVDVPRPLTIAQADGRTDTLFADGGFAVGRATHATLALDQRFDHGFRLSVKGFFKDFAEVPAAAIPPSEASGLEIDVGRSVGRVQGWLGYSLAWVWSLPGSGLYTERFAGRNLVNAGLRAGIGRGVEVDARVAYGSGLPYSAIPLTPANYAGYANDGYPGASYPGWVALSSGGTVSASGGGIVPTPSAEPYLRVDLGLSRTFTPQWEGRATTIAPYIRLLNALDRRDAVFYRYRQDDRVTRPIDALPLLPTVGVEWKF
ncbi:MAG TPA: TonB-dependent receptor [Longimicrobiaceae bacterium]|nr:TonB-dependent receptor [Longimicrobiaceae bacterium]